MTTSQELLSSIGTALNGLVAAGLNAQTPSHELYEVYVLGLALEAAASEMAAVTYEDKDENTTTNLIFPKKPRYLKTATALYTHAVISWPTAPTLEAHVSLYVQGRSGCRHEGDVVVLDRETARTIRAGGPGTAVPPAKRLRLVAECKFYTASIGINLTRSYWGLQAEFHAPTECFFVLNKEADSARRYLRSHGRGQYQPGVVPNDTSETRIRGLFQEVFKQHRLD